MLNYATYLFANIGLDIEHTLNVSNEAITADLATLVGVLRKAVDFGALEFVYAKDISDIARMRDTMRYDYNKAYYDKARAKGIIMKSKQPKDYKRLSKLRDSLTNDEIYKKECLNGKHDDLPIEVPAMMKGYEESEICSGIWRKIMVHFGFWGG